MERNFRAMLEARWKIGNFVCVGLDSDYKRIPEAAKGNTVFETILNFNRAIVCATHPCVCAYKPNIAFYEAYGDVGWLALRETIVHIRKFAPEVPVILDAKRADIGNTNIGYVREAFEFLDADAITVNPYFGEEALQPFLARTEKGVIVLCRTSNPGADEFQDQKIVLDFGGLVELVGDADEANTLNGRYSWSYPTGGYRMPIYQYVALRVSRHWNKNGNCALVVGATYLDELREVRKIVGDMPILVPGIGTQGGDVEKTVKAGIDSRGMGMIINSSSGIIFASKGDDFADAALAETKKLRNAINQYRLAVQDLS